MSLIWTQSSIKGIKSRLQGTWSWPSGWCIGLRSWLRGFDAQLGHLYDACTSLPQKSQAAIKWLAKKKKKKKKKTTRTKQAKPTSKQGVLGIIVG